MSDRKDPTNNDIHGEDGPTKTEDEKCKDCVKKGKKASFFRLRRGRKLQNRKNKKKGFVVNSRSWGCCLSLKRRKHVDLSSSGESPSSDPNSSDFTFDMLRALIEGNEFWSEDLNTHLDSDVE